MDRKTLTIILAIALIACFFLPYTSFGKTSMFDIVKASGGGWKKYLLLILPICGILLLIGELNNNYVIARSLLTWLPLLTILFLMIIDPLIEGAKIDMIFKSIGKLYGVGMWVGLASSLVLAFYNPRPR